MPREIQTILKDDQFAPTQVTDLIHDMLQEMCEDFNHQLGQCDEGWVEGAQMLSVILRAGDFLEADGGYEPSDDYKELSQWADAMYDAGKHLAPMAEPA